MFDIPLALRDLRGGAPGAKAAFVSRFTSLITDNEYNADHWGLQFEALSLAVDRLSENAVEPEQVERYIKNELRAAKTLSHRESSNNILCPKSTARERVKAGKSDGVIRRQRGADQQPFKIGPGRSQEDYLPANEENGHLDLVPTSAPLVTGEDGRPYRPGRFAETAPDDDALGEETRAKLAPTAQERDVLELLESGYALKEIAIELGISTAEVRGIQHKLRDRAKRLGIGR